MCGHTAKQGGTEVLNDPARQAASMSIDAMSRDSALVSHEWMEVRLCAVKCATTAVHRRDHFGSCVA